MKRSSAKSATFRGCALESLELRRLLSISPAIEFYTDDRSLYPIDDVLIIDQPESIQVISDDSQLIIASESSTISGVLARFNGTGRAEQFTATIDWGDEVFTQGTIEKQTDGTYAVVGSHNYGAKGDFYVAVEINAADGSYGYDFHQVLTRADDLTLTVSPDVYSYTTDSPEETYVASFFDREAADESAYTVTIDWGDGTISAGRVVRSWDGSFDVVGDHAYAVAGDYSMSFTVARQGARGASLSAAGNAQVWEDTFDEWIDVDDGTEYVIDDDPMSDGCDTIDDGYVLDENGEVIDDGGVIDDEFVYDGELVDGEVSFDYDHDWDYGLISLPAWGWSFRDLGSGLVLYASGMELELTSVSGSVAVEQTATSLTAQSAAPDRAPTARVSSISSDVFQAEKKLTFGDSDLPAVI